MGVKTFPTYNEGNNLYWKDGTKLSYSATGPTGIAPPDPALLPDIAQTVARLDMMAAEVDPKAPWKASQAEEWDSQTLYTWIKENQINPDFMRLVSTATDAIFGQEPRDLSLLYTLFYLASSGNEKHQGTFERNFQTGGGAQQDRFHGGSQLISLRMADALGDRVVLSAPVHRITRHRSGVEVHADGVKATGKFAIVAIPPALAGRIDYHPLLPALRDQLTQRTPMGSYAKVDLVFKKPFWRDDGFSGQVVSVNGPSRSPSTARRRRASRACCWGSSAAPTREVGTRRRRASVARRWSRTSLISSASRPATRSSTSRTSGPTSGSPGATPSPGSAPAPCSTSARRSA